MKLIGYTTIKSIEKIKKTRSSLGQPFIWKRRVNHQMIPIFIFDKENKAG
jgi:hypothetical protein